MSASQQRRQMCCWFFGVCLQVCWNLFERIAEDIAVGVYKMCAICCCCCRLHSHHHRRQRRRAGDKSSFDGGAADSNYEHPRRIGCEDDAYRNVSREVADRMLAAAPAGTFIVRPSTHAAAIGTLSVQQDGRVYHLPIRRRRDNRLALGTPKPQERCFPDLSALINYHVSNYLILYADNRSARTLLLPYTTASAAAAAPTAVAPQ